MCGGLFALLFMASTLGYDNGAPYSRFPPMGWSSWQAFGPPGEHPVEDYCDENSVKMAVDAFVELGFPQAGYKHFHLDDCWAASRDANGTLQPDPKQFPSGMKAIVDYVHSKNLVFGIYTSAAAVNCVGGRPGSRGHYEQDAQTFASWEVDYVKLDWCAPKGGITPQQVYPVFSRALNASGRPIHLSMSESGKQQPWTGWGYQVAQSWRVGQDHRPYWENTKQLISVAAEMAPNETGRPYGWNDMDMLETGNAGQSGAHGNMTDEEFRTEYTMWAIAASPLVITTPLFTCDKDGACRKHITPLQQELLFNKEVIAVNQDVTPQGRPVSSPPGTAAPWVRHLTGGDAAVVFYNGADQPLPASISFSQLGWGTSAVASVRDLWKQHNEGNFTAVYSVQAVQPHCVVALRIARIQ